VPTPAELDTGPLVTAGPLVTVVHSEACHLCDDARAALADFSERYPIQVRYLSATGPEGRELIARHRAPMFPLVLVDGQYFSTGRLPRGKLRRLLDSAPVPAPAGTAPDPALASIHKGHS
jgi:hypothetical protein